MREADDVARGEDEAAAELKRVLAETVLAMPGLPRARPGRRVVAPEQVEQRRLPKAGRAVRPALLVDEERERDPGVLAERPRVLPVAEADRRQASPRGAEGLLVLAQLRDVLAAEDSAVVPEEDEHGRPALPKRAEPDLVSVDVRQTDVRERGRDGRAHGRRE